MATYAIVVSSATKAIRRVIADDNGNVGSTANSVTVTQADGSVSNHPLIAGEQIIIQTVSPNAVTVDGPAQWATNVQTATGVAPPTSTMALVDGTNTVQQIICGESALDAANVQGFTVVDSYSPLICIGCTYTPATGLFTIPAHTIPAGAAGNVGSVTPLVIPATVIAKPIATGV